MKIVSNRHGILALVQTAGLSLLLVTTFVMELWHTRDATRFLAETMSRTFAAEKLHSREQFVNNGGVYMKVANGLRPDPALAHRPDRDIRGLKGELLTLVAPAQLFTQGRESGVEDTRIYAVIKTFLPRAPEEIPDAWEKEAMAGFQAGRREAGVVVERNGARFLRFMVPLPVEADCVVNRPGLNLVKGGLLGGLSMTLPLAPFELVGQTHLKNAVVLHMLLWLLGAGVIGWTFLVSRRHEVSLCTAERQSRAASNDLAMTFDAIDDIMTVQTMDRRIIRCNKAACDFFGSTEEALLGSYCHELFRGASVVCPECPDFQNLVDGHIHRSQVEHRSMGKTFAVSVAPVLDEEGKVVKVVHRARDITASLQMEKQLRQAQKMEAIGTLAGGIAHDFNNILAGIIGYAELAQRALPKGSAPRRDVQEVVKAGLRARDLVRQILTFSRRAEQKYQPLKVQLVVKEAMKLLRASIPASIVMKQEVADADGMVIADPSQIHQLVMNLCTNAYQAMREKGGTMSLSLAQVELTALDAQHKIVLAPGPYIRLTVSDTGVGMAASVRERIFDPYFTTKPQGEGTGMGLAVVHGIVTEIGGHISVYSEPGRGSTFHVYMPVCDASMQRPEQQDASAVIPTGGERLLVVDDEESVLAMEKRILEGLGYCVTAFASPVEARDAFAATPLGFDMIITDMSMPLMSGAEMLAECRLLRADIPAIICSGFSDGIGADKAQRLGVGRLILKPVTVRDLALAVREVLDRVIF